MGVVAFERDVIHADILFASDLVDLEYGLIFAGQLQFQIGRQQEGSPAQLKMQQLRDRIVAMGVAWPPASRETEQERMRARGQEPGKPLRVQ